MLDPRLNRMKAVEVAAPLFRVCRNFLASLMSCSRADEAQEKRTSHTIISVVYMTTCLYNGSSKTDG